MDIEENQTIYGITFGAFDMLHAGHSLFLLQCLNHCDELTIGLHVDPSIERSGKNKPVQSVTERYFQLSAIKGVTQIIPYETEHDLKNIVAAHSNLDYYFLGGDYTYSWVCPEDLKDIIALRDICVMYMDRYHDYSSTELRGRIEKKYQERLDY